MMQRWPSNSRTAETVLIKREADQLRVISPLRHKVIAPLSLTIPNTNKEFVGVKGLLGQKGLIEGKDYRDQDVLADFNAVPGTSWYLISKIDKSEIYSDLALRTGTISLTGLILLMLIISSIFYIYKTKQSSTYKNLFLKEKELNEFQIRSKAITDAAKDAIIMIDGEGNISFWNPAAETIFGYNSDEVMGKNLHTILAPLEYHAQHSKAFNRFKFSGEGDTIGKTLELTAITKHKTEISIELGLSAIKNNHEWHAVGIIKDISQRKKTEEKLIESEEKFRKAFNTSTDSMIISRLSDGLLLDVNEGFCKLTGFSKQDTEGKTIFELDIWGDLSDREKLINLIMRDGFVENVESMFRTKDGTLLNGLFSASLISINDEPHLISITRDITERKRIEKSLKQSEELFRHSFNYSATGMCIVGLDGKFQRVNDSLKNMLGYSETEITKYHFNDITYPDDISVGKSRFNMMLEGKISNAEFEKRYLTKDKKIIWCHISTSLVKDGNNKPQFFISQLIDITERKEIENALKQSEENYRHIINGMNDMVFVIDVNGKFLDVNNSTSEVLGYTKEELLQLGPTDIDNNFSKDDIAGLINRIPSDEVQSFETSHRTKAGKSIPVEIKSTMIPYKDRRVILSIVRDISERKEAHRRILESEEKFRTMITQMQLGIAVHEIICDESNTPIDYRFLDINESFERLTGLKKEDIINKRILEVLPNTEHTWIEKYGYVALTGEPLQFEDYAKELDKYFSVVAYRPKPMQFAVIIDDITDRKMAEKELVEHMNEITRFNNLMIGREEKMIGLKTEINDLLKKLGKEKKYNVIEE